ncbi:Alcohol dehydrogenase-like [Quillaja saponaria]|uniref:Alcohol dehydrogenase-like n=1 Tax=Quillaja saponaria TaxID=32244 RepID=A0AAD7LKI5_QUISA|nr:Alcohol dehydrogenase-like [Quillaja saponaria]
MESKSSIEQHAGKSIRCKAAICRNASEPLVIEEIEVDPPKAWESPIGFFPRILGHEAVGVVESVGENVEEVKEGDIVVPVFLSNCGECKDCKSSKSNCCSIFKNRTTKDMPRDGSSRFRSMINGEAIYHCLNVSSFSEYTVVDVTHVVKITDDLPVDKACLLSCGVSTGLGAAWKVADVEQGSTVAIFGLGAVGLAVAVGARERGASKIIGVDLNPQKFEIGKQFGVTDFVNPTTCGDKTVSEVIKEMTDGGADYCFECIGLASLMNDAFSSSREGWGKTIILGVEMHGSALAVNPYQIQRGRSITGSLFGGFKPKSDIPLIAKKYLDNELFILDDFITHEVSFQDINKAFQYLLEGESLRCIIWMDRRDT